MSVLYLADPADVLTPVVDLDGWVEGDVTGFTLVRFKPGGVDHTGSEGDQFLTGGEIAGGEQISVQSPPVLGQIELTAIAPDLVTLREELYLPLAGMLDQIAVLVWQPQGYDEPLYIDTYRSDIPAMFDDEARDGYFLGKGIDISYRFSVWHHPHARAAGVNLASAVEVSNGLGGVNLLEATNPGDAPSEGRLQLVVPGDEHLVWALVGIKRGTLEFPSYDISGAEPVFDAWQMLHRQILTPTDPDAFEGSYRLVAVYTAAEDIFHFEGRYGTALAGPQGNAGTEQPVLHDWTDISSFSPTLLDLGEIRYDAQDPRLVIELWGRSEGGADVGSFGQMYLIPSDTFMELASPGFLSGEFGLQRFDGADLVLTGSPEITDDGAVNLATGDTATIPGVYVDGSTFPVGRQRCEFRGTVRNKDRTREKQGELQVEKNTVGEDSANLYSRRGEAVTRWDEDNRRAVSFDVTDPDDHYDIRVSFTEAGGPGKRIHLNRLRMSYVPWITAGRAMVVDQGRRSSYIADDNGARVAPLHRTATLYLPPGGFTIAHLFGVQSPNKYDGVDRRGALPLIGEITVENTTDVTPRTLHP